MIAFPLNYDSSSPVIHEASMSIAITAASGQLGTAIVKAMSQLVGSDRVIVRIPANVTGDFGNVTDPRCGAARLRL